jgi:putative NADPH-quinone reductase
LKTLVIVAHPNLETSVINKRWVEELKKQPEKYTVHDLYEAYPDGIIDVEKEQQRIEAHDNLVLQFPIFWFNSPPLLKKWLDDVFLYGWAFGSKGGQKLKDRKVALAVSAGIEKADFTAEGKYRYTLEQLLTPFETTFRYCNSNYRSFHAFYGAETMFEGKESAEDKQSALRELDENTQDYLKFLDNL